MYNNLWTDSEAQSFFEDLSASIQEDDSLSAEAKIGKLQATLHDTKQHLTTVLQKFLKEMIEEMRAMHKREVEMASMRVEA